MQRRTQSKVDTLRRVQAHLDTHAEAVGPLKDTEARKQLDRAVEQANAHSLIQGTAERELAGSGNQVRQLAAQLKASHMTPMAKFARAKLREAPDFKALSQVHHNLKAQALVGSARAMATAALPYAGAFTEAQFPADAVQELADAADALEAALKARETAGARRVAATAGVRQAVRLGREAVAMLDPIVTKRLAGQEDLLAGWRSAKRIASTRHVISVVAPDPTPVPAPAPAAQEVKAA